MSPCRSGAGEPEGPLLKGVGGLRRGSPLGYSSSPSQGKGWELVTTQELLAQECWSSPHGQTLESYWPGHVLPGWGEVTTGSDSCLVVLGDQAPSVLFQEGKEQWGLELWKRARDLAPYRWSSPGLTLSTEAAQNLLTKAINSVHQLKFHGDLLQSSFYCVAFIISVPSLRFCWPRNISLTLSHLPSDQWVFFYGLSSNLTWAFSESRLPLGEPTLCEQETAPSFSTWVELALA